MTPRPSEHYEFGAFLLDAGERELRRNGEPIPLTGKAFDLLLTLVRAAGQTVTKPELMSAVWPETAVEDNNLKQTLFLLRKALGDDAGDSAYIQTVPRRGYKFVCPVTRLASEALPDVSVLSPVQIRPPDARIWIATAVALAIIAAGARFWGFSRTNPMTDRDTLVLADFVNTTGDPNFDTALRAALAIELEQSPFLKIASDDVMREGLRLGGRNENERLTPQLAREVCVRENETATLDATIASLGKTYAITLEAANCQNGEVLAREQGVANDKEHILEAIATAARRIRAKLGESLASIEKVSRPRNFRVTTSSLDALEAYSTGLKLYRNESQREAIPYFRRATELDPNFAMAWSYLATSYGDLEGHASSPREREYSSKALALIPRVSQIERLSISALYYFDVAEDWEKLGETTQQWTREFPRDHLAHRLRAGWFEGVGRYGDALAEYQETYALDPANRASLDQLINAYMLDERLGEAKELAQMAIAKKRATAPIHFRLLRIAHIEGDDSGVRQAMAWFDGKPEEYMAVGLQGRDELIHGRRRHGTETLRRAAAMMKKNLQPMLPAFTAENEIALWDAAMGNCKTAPGEAPHSAVPTLKAVCGDDAVAEKLLDSARNPRADLTLYLRGLSALRRGNAKEAADAFQWIVDHPGGCWGAYYTVSHVGLARAASLAGDAGRARKAYEAFFEKWKDADSDIPILIQARNEYAKLIRPGPD